MRTIEKILIANRGEIALRLVRACRELGIAAVAVYSDADREAPHVLAADEAYRLGPAPSVESYLLGNLVLEIARKSGADAIHPGYGFLSEQAEFAEACEREGMKFIGPSAAAMRRLGSKIEARKVAQEAGIPRVPGSALALSSWEDAATVANQIGYPVMMKASAGGGGKGMRTVLSAEDLQSAFRAAQGEAERAFGSGELYLEKLIQRPRHIEIQVLADEHGHCVSLGERECSIQRRHQKVMEEAPSTAISEELRRRMGDAAVRLVTFAGYTNAGTVEFLVEERTDRPASDFYFLEVNTRLQVEHPVTELVTGLDLVHLQIAIARGEPLPFTQADIHMRGHAIECRIYAEDPDNGFMPSPGKIMTLRSPSGPGIREDSGIFEGWTIPNDYDPMLSKLIAHAPTRDLAIARMRRAIDEYVLLGPRNNLGLFREILDNPDFQAARLDTGFLDRLLSSRTEQSLSGEEEIATIAAALFQKIASRQVPNLLPTPPSALAGAWKQQARREGLR